MNSVKKRLFKIISEHVGTKEQDLTLNLDFADDLNISGFELAELISAIEDEMEIEIDPSDAKKIKGVEDLVSLVEDLIII